VHGFLTDKQCNDIVEHVKKSPGLFSSHSSLTEQSVSSHKDGHFKHLELIEQNISSCKEIKSSIQSMIDDYIIDSGFKQSNIFNSWINIQTENSILREHAHPLSQVSGALYLKCDEYSSALYFHNPNPFISFTHISKKVTEYSYAIQKFKPGNGMMLLFPSWLKHGSNGELNKSDERIVLSFNAV
jgi:uncharacterized protein (TIGR02466 family)